MKMPIDLIQFRKNYLMKKIAGLPTGRITDIEVKGTIYKVVYVRSYPGHPEYVHHRYSINSAIGRSLLEMIQERESLKQKLEKIDIEKDNNTESLVFFSVEYYRTCDEYWESIKKVADTNYRWDKPKNAPVYNGILFRSKSEMTIAMILDEMGLEYVYEPTVDIGGRTFNPDFAVYFRETGKVFYIEHFGKMGKESYRLDNYDKFTYYINSGLKAGKDILMFFETDDAGIEPEVFRQQISALIMVSISEVPYRKKTK